MLGILNTKEAPSVNASVVKAARAKRFTAALTAIFFNIEIIFLPLAFLEH